MSKIFVTILVAVMFALVVPAPTVQADDLSALVQGNLGYVYGRTGYGGGYYSATDYARYRLATRPGGVGQRAVMYDRAYDTPDRGMHQASQRNVNIWGALNLGLNAYNAWETRKVNRKLDRMMGDEHRPRRERRERSDEDYREPVRRAEHRPEPEPPVVQPPAPPLAPEQAEVLNASGCEVVLYLNGSYLLALKPGEKVVVPTLVGLTAAGSFNGKMGFALINPFSNGAVITTPGR
ncbi:MAG: hypothetical protein AAB561_01090 [Patescibacteria group bacterium]